MHGVELAAFAFLVGITVAGLSGSVMELITGCQLSFRSPYVSAEHIGRSLRNSVLAGPLMLANEAITARRAGEVSLGGLACCAVAAILWASATGVLVLELVGRVVDLVV